MLGTWDSYGTISIHALLAESDGSFCPADSCGWHFYPRSPCGERRSEGTTATSAGIFLSTLSLRRATLAMAGYTKAEIISIHALLAESDYTAIVCAPPTLNFYPRSPCGERPPAGAFLFSSGYFYPRSPCGERLVGLILIDCAQDISIHALLAESDSPKAMIWRFSSHFYPRSPCGERRLFSFFCWRTPEFLSTLSLRRATHAALASHLHDGFLSTLSLRRATGWHLGIPDDTF